MLKKTLTDRLDQLFDDILIINREVRSAGFSDKEEKAILKNIEKIGENVLVMMKRVNKEIR